MLRGRFWRGSSDRVGRALLTAVCSVVGMGIAGCGSDPILFDPLGQQQDERSQAGNNPLPYLRPLPTTREDPAIGARTSGVDESGRSVLPPTTGPDLDTSPIMRLSLHEIIHRAVMNNHDVRVAGYQPAIEGTRVIETQAHFDPVFYTNFQFQHKDDLTGGSIFNSFTNGGVFFSDQNRSNTGSLQFGIQENLDNGGQIQLQYENLYNWFSPQTTLLNPYYQSDITLQLTQPLLRNSGYAVNQARIVINRLNQKVSLLEFRKAVEQNASDIEKAYWQLVQAERFIAIQEQLIAQTEATYNILNTRMQTGLDVSQLQVSEALTELESRRAQLLQYKSRARDLSDQLKGLMSDPEFPVTSPVVILPADIPVEVPMTFDLQDQLNTALENRFEMGEQQLKIDSAAVTVTVAKNNLLPQLDFIGSIGESGVAGNEGDAIKKNSDLNHFDYSVGFKLQVPIGNREARAIYLRSQLQQLQAIEQYRSQIEQVSVDVSTSARAVPVSWDVIVQSRKSRFSAEIQLAAIVAQEQKVEALSPTFVQLRLDTQQRLAQALQEEAQAVANYNEAIAQLERAKGTLLRYNNVILQEEHPEPADRGWLH